MPSDSTNDILIPKVLILPITEPANGMINAAIGTVVISGAKMYFAATEGVFEEVTSA